MTEPNRNEWSVYIVKCNDGTYYCGIAKNVKKRIKKHNNGSGAKYTRSRIPVVLLIERSGLNKSQALSLEYRVKRKRKSQKINFLLNASV